MEKKKQLSNESGVKAAFPAKRALHIYMEELEKLYGNSHRIDAYPESVVKVLGALLDEIEFFEPGTTGKIVEHARRLDLDISTLKIK